MGLVNYLEEIVDRHIEAVFESQVSASHGIPIRSRTEAKALFTPLLDAIRFALAKPEMEHLHEIERANWDKAKAEYELGRVSQRFQDGELREAILRKENKALASQVMELNAKRDSLNDQLDRREAQAQKYTSSLKLEVGRLNTKIERLQLKAAGLEKTIFTKDREISALERAVMNAQVTKKY